MVIPPPKAGVSKSVYLSVELVARLERIREAEGYRKLSPIIEHLLEQAVSQWEAAHGRAADDE